MINEDEIKAYAESRGALNVHFVNDGAFGWSIFGEGINDRGWPIVWDISYECGIAWGCGGTGSHQIKPELFKLPKSHPKIMNILHTIFCSLRDKLPLKSLNK